MTTIRSLSALVLASFLAACANMSSLPPAPDKAPKHNYVYQIGPGDELDLKVWRNPDLSVKVPVRPDGKITAPLIKDIVAVGKTPQVLGREIEEKLSTYIRDPSVSVVVTKIVGDPLSVVRVIGGVLLVSLLASLVLVAVIIGGPMASAVRPVVVVAGGDDLEVQVGVASFDAVPWRRRARAPCRRDRRSCCRSCPGRS